MTKRVCTECNIAKAPEHFHKKASAKDGLKSKCKLCIVERSKSYYSTNKDEVTERNLQWRDDNPDAVKAMSKRAQQVQVASGNNAAKIARRRANLLKATPKWLTEKQHADINGFYPIAKRLEAKTGEKYHVDHIVPLQGEFVCGLHVPWNLQVLPANLNIAKGNSFGCDL